VLFDEVLESVFLGRSSGTADVGLTDSGAMSEDASTILKK
jgi:hypothetical protein